MGTFQGPPAGPAPGVPHPGRYIQPHRGAVILVFGILGILVCIIFGIVAWVMGNSDLREMDAGRMDPSGRGLTSAGRVLGIISVCLAVLGVIMAIVWIAMLRAAVGHIPGM